MIARGGESWRTDCEVTRTANQYPFLLYQNKLPHNLHKRKRLSRLSDPISGIIYPLTKATYPWRPMNTSNFIGTGRILHRPFLTIIQRLIKPPYWRRLVIWGTVSRDERFERRSGGHLEPEHDLEEGGIPWLSRSVRG